MDGFILGAYAAMPVDQEFPGSLKEVDFYEQLANLADVAGVELPFNGALHPKGVEWLASRLKKNWRILLTYLPGQMQMMARDPHFGLASVDQEGRERAINLVKSGLRELQDLLEIRPDLEVVGVEVHSGPRFDSCKQSQSSLDAFHSSLEELLEVSTLRAPLMIEHCDSWSEKRKIAKGFLSFNDELVTADKLGVGISINWARSVLDEQNVHAAFEHVQAALEKKRLSAVIFSGVANGHPLYGAWDDSHAPFRETVQESSSEALLLTKAEAARVLRLLRNQIVSPLDPPTVVGLKIQVLPYEATVEERIGLVRRNLQILREASILSSTEK